MVNAITVLGEFDALLPAAERPEYTEGYEGFFHPIEVSGSSGEASLTYIVRDFDADHFATREQQLRDAAEFLNRRYGTGTVEVEIREQYRNMAEHLRGMDFLRDNAFAAMAACGMEPRVVPVRGGTDGAQLPQLAHWRLQLPWRSRIHSRAQHGAHGRRARAARGPLRGSAGVSARGEGRLAIRRALCRLARVPAALCWQASKPSGLLSRQSTTSPQSRERRHCD